LGSTDGAARSGKGLKIALAIAALVVAAAAAWYWFVNQAPRVSAGGIGNVAGSNPASIAVPDLSNPVGTPPGPPSTQNSETLPAAPALEPASAALPIARPTAVSETLANASAPLDNAAARNLPDRLEEAVAAEPVKKATLGQVRLAAPKITR